MQMFTDGIRDREFQKVLQKTRQQNSTEGLVPLSSFKLLSQRLAPLMSLCHHTVVGRSQYYSYITMGAGKK